MAFFNELVRTIAAVEGMDEMTVRGIGINVRDQGLITKGGRGLSAARMTVEDAANLLIGVNGASASKHSGEMVPVYRSLKIDRVWNETGHLSGPLASIFTENVEFGSAFEKILVILMDEKDDQNALKLALTQSIDFGASLKRKIADGVFDECVTLEINFTRPDLIINIIFKDAYTDKTHCQIDFCRKEYSIETDRYDITAITQKTLRAVALIL